MNQFQAFWQRLDGRARFGLASGVLLIGALAIALGLMLRTDYQVLFAGLAQQDAATITAELDKLKTPYRLDGDGNTILVPADIVHRTRLKLVDKELPLRGAVGLELFNSSEVGMTEFTQKVNYQRALQGELTRTIQSLDEVQSVRVHLVLAEQGLFRKDVKNAKASISLALKPGRTLEAAQVQGIQRLVGAAVPDIKPADVTIVDQRGLALTRRNADGADAPDGADSLDDKRALEAYLLKKVTAVLERAVGAEQSIASVDVSLSTAATKTTTESVVGNGTDADRRATGTLVRERTVSRDGPADGQAAQSGTVSHEADYQVGRKVEQVVAGAGAINRINVAVVVKGSHPAEQLERLKAVVAAAAGISAARGDIVTVYGMDQVAAAPAQPPTVAAPEPPAAAAEPQAPARNAWVLAVLGALLAAAIIALLVRRARPRAAVPTLSLAERQAALAQVRRWLADAPAVPLEQERL